MENLLQTHIKDKNNAIILEGYLEFHKNTCNKDDCPLKQHHVPKTAILEQAGHLINSDGNSDHQLLIITTLSRMFFYAIKKFPNDANLRLAYSFYLTTNFNMKQQA